MYEQMGKFILAILYVIVAGAIDRGLYPYILQHVSPLLGWSLIVALTVGELWGLGKILSGSE